MSIKYPAYVNLHAAFTKSEKNTPLLALLGGTFGALSRDLMVRLIEDHLQRTNVAPGKDTGEVLHPDFMKVRSRLIEPIKWKHLFGLADVKRIQGVTDLGALIEETEKAYRARKPKNTKTISSLNVTPEDVLKIIFDFAAIPHEEKHRFPNQRDKEPIPTEPFSGLRWERIFDGLAKDKFGFGEKISAWDFIDRRVIELGRKYKNNYGAYPVSGPISEYPGLTWDILDIAYKARKGADQTSLAIVFDRADAQEKNGIDLKNLNHEVVTGWIINHVIQYKKWPGRNTTTKIKDFPHETWAAIDLALRVGTRGLPGRSSLHILANEFVYKKALEFVKNRGYPPHALSGSVDGFPGLTWDIINQAFRNDQSANKKTLFDFLGEKGLIKNYKKSFAQRDILLAVEEYRNDHDLNLPDYTSGPVTLPESGTKTSWKTINKSLKRGDVDGVPAGTNLHLFLLENGYKTGKKIKATGLSLLNAFNTVAWMIISKDRTPLNTEDRFNHGLLRDTRITVGDFVTKIFNGDVPGIPSRTTPDKFRQFVLHRLNDRNYKAPTEKEIYEAMGPVI